MDQEPRLPAAVYQRRHMPKQLKQQKRCPGLADRIAGLSLSDWAIIVGIACTVITCAVNWYFRWKEREDRRNGYATKAEE